MSTKLFLYLVLCVGVLSLVLLHGLIARRLLARVPAGSPRRRRWARIGAAAAVLALDLPLAHLFLVYKFYSPVLLDEIFHGIAGPFIALHANVLVLGIALLIWDHVLSPLRSRIDVRRKKVSDAIAVGSVEPAANFPASEKGTADSVPAIQLLAGPGPILPRRLFIRTAALAATGYATSAATLGAMDSTGSFRLERVVIKIPNLPTALKGTTIAMIADVHSSLFMTRDDMERYGRALMQLKTDMIFLVGDFINSKMREVYPLAEAFSSLRAPLGVYGVTGNHDYYPKNIEGVAKEIEQAGIRLLRNENIAIEKNGEKLWLLGIDDEFLYDIKPYLADGRTERGTVENMLKGVPENGTTLFLCHRPYPFEEYSRLGFDLMLSGHTHGGQVVLAQLDNLNLSFASLASRFIEGLYKSRYNPKSQLYVTRGIGTVGVPLRVNCPPEITHIVLV